MNVIAEGLSSQSRNGQMRKKLHSELVSRSTLFLALRKGDY